MNKLLFLVGLICGIVGISVGTIGLALASSSSDDSEESEEKEVCSIKLKDGKMVEMVRETVVLSDGTEIEMHTCEELQADWANATYEEYLGNTPAANQAREITGKMFSEGLSYSEAKRELALDKLADDILSK
ncbi:MAG: hypothetical protein WA941_06055 [Nitrososphaeraceae archaeon]